MSARIRNCPPLQASALLLAVLVGGLGGCSDEVASGPPSVRYGEDLCEFCNMILNDEHFDSAMIIEDVRGGETLLFDDIGDQLMFEKTNPGNVVIERWVRDLPTGAWVNADDATFIQSPNLRSPMGFGLAAFATAEDAQAKLDELGAGKLYSRTELWAIPDP